ncbi:hypothetical protein ACFL1Q_00715 [Patescibacteria group bacterium]
MKRKFNKKTYLLILITGLFLVSSVYLTIQTVTTGAELVELDSQKDGCLNNRRDLENELVKSVSVSNLVEKSSELGFVKPDEESIVYISADEAVAKLP